MEKIESGLYFVATPIGNSKDITLRALDLLRFSDVLVAEDTRNLRKLMDIHDIPIGNRPLISYNDHNGKKQRPKLLRLLAEKKSMVYTSDAGTPLISDPGFNLAIETISSGYFITSLPGASAVINALVISGLPTLPFIFLGFLPARSSARCSRLRAVKELDATLIFFESSKRLPKMLRDASEVLGGKRNAVYCRELTKRYEEVRRGSLANLSGQLCNNSVKGEVVVLIEGAKDCDFDKKQLLDDLEGALEKMSFKDAISFVSEIHGSSRRETYQLALSLRNGRV